MWEARKGAPHEGGAHASLLSEFPTLTYERVLFLRGGANTQGGEKLKGG